MSNEGPNLQRLTTVLEERGIPVLPVLEVATAVGTKNVTIGVGTLTGRVQLLVPSTAEAKALVAPSATLPERSLLLIAAHGQQLSHGVMTLGVATPRDAVDDVGPAAGRARWLPAIEALATGTIKNRLRYVSEERGTVTVMYKPRTGDAETAFARELAATAALVGAPDTWRPLYEEAGAGNDIGVTLECTSAGPLPRLALRFGPTSWERAIDLAKAMVDVDRARDAAVRMGMLAGVLGGDTMRSAEAVLDQGEPDFVVWLGLA